MIIIDTNVMSEMMRAEPDERVAAWAAATGRLHTTAVSLAEISYGLARLPAGRRRNALTASAADVFADFGRRILPFDDRAARQYGDLVVQCERVGRPITTADAQIASVCVAHGASLATRNVTDFEVTAVSVIDPWRWPDR